MTLSDKIKKGCITVPHWKLLFCLFLTLCSIRSWGINYNVPSSGSQSQNLSLGNSYTIKDPGGDNSYYNNCNGYLKLTAPQGYVIKLQGSYTTERNYDVIEFYNSITSISVSTRLGVYSGNGDISVQSTSNVLTVHFSSDASVTNSGFSLSVTLIPEGGINTGGIIGEYASGCIDISDLYSPNVSCQYGTFSNPAASSGVAVGRHTVITSPGHDPRTGNQLSVLPPNGNIAVKLGNESTGAQAERITYAYKVDTSVYDMLIMKYAAVLQDPNHSSSQQPRFTFRLLDSTGADINAACYSADFKSSAALGWNGYGSGSNKVWWKDWTPVAVDLNPLHGRTIYIQLTTYDCLQTAHYGYAYFAFECGNKFIASTSCGDNVSNTFTAPDGFRYNWHMQGSSTTLSTNRSLSVSTAGTYLCDMTFVGASNSSCGFTLEATAGERYPFANYSYSFIDTVNCDLTVRFNNQSVVSRNIEHTDLTNERCESYYWDFGDGSSSTDVNPTHIYNPGEYQVTLVAKLGGGTCQDTVVHNIVISNFCQVYDSVSVSYCDTISYLFFDTLITSPGIYERDSANVHRTLRLERLLSTSSIVADTVVENQLPHLFAGVSFSDTISDTVLVRTNVLGCDSLITYTLNIHWNQHVTLDSTICENSLPFTWDGIHFTSSGTLIDTLADQYGADSIITRNLHINLLSRDTVTETLVENQLPHIFAGVSFSDTISDTVLVRTNALGCDSLITYTLNIHWNQFVSVDSTICEDMLPLTWDGVYFTSPGTLMDTLADQYGADSIVTRNLHVNLLSRDTISETLVENQLPHIFAGVSFSDTISDTVLVRTNALGCDSLITYTLNIHWNQHVTVDSTICENNLPLTWDGVYFTSSGTLMDTLVDQYGADSIITRNLHVNSLSRDTVTETLVENQLPHFFAGVSFSNSISDTVLVRTNALGCDSLITYTLNIHWNQYVTVDSTICENNLPLTWDGVYFTSSGTLMDTLADQYGADSIVTRNLHVNSLSRDTVTETLVENQLPHIFAGVNFSDSISDTVLVRTNALGCDSLITYTLNIHWNQYVTVDSTICENNLPLTWDGVYFTSSGTLMDTLADQYGADSIVTRNLHVNSLSRDTVTETLVENQLPHFFAGVSFSNSISDTVLVRTNALGCDSLITYTLNIHWNQHVSLDSTICENNLPLTWDGIYFTSAGTQINTLTDQYGADSIITMNLHVCPIYNITRVVDICDNETYIINGIEENNPGVFVETSLKTINGCDSVETITLNVWPTFHQIVNHSMCQGDHYSFEGVEYDSTGDFDFHYTSAHGCDSIRSLNLTVNPVYQQEVSMTGCKNQSLEYDGHYFSHEGLYPLNYETVAGCDSIITLNLEFVAPAKAVGTTIPRRCDWEHPEFLAKDQSQESNSREWFIDDFLVSTDAEFKYEYPEELQDDTLWLTLVAHHRYSCDDTTKIFVTYRREFIYPPNVFTPEESTNNRFVLGHDNIHDGHVWIYTRDGQFVYDFDLIEGYWDGKLNGVTLPQATYTWICKYHSNDEPRNPKQKVGTVTLLR